MKTSLNSNRSDWHHDHNIIKLDCHIWSPQDEDGRQEPNNRPIVGFSYQSFLEGNFFVSLARPSDIEEIQHHASLGQKLHAMSILHLADCHTDIVQTLLAEGRVTSKPFLGFSLPQVAMLHIAAGNDELSSAICMHLVRKGNARQMFRAGANEILGNEEIGEFYLEKILPVLRVAERVVQYQKLNKELGRKPPSKLIKI